MNVKYDENFMFNMKVSDIFLQHVTLDITDRFQFYNFLRFAPQTTFDNE